MAHTTTPRYFTYLIASLLTPIANTTAQTNTPTAQTSEGRLQYIGDTAQISVGVTHNGQPHGELSGVLSETSDNAWLGEGWTSQREGGFKLSHHQLTTQGNVRKLFVAIDQNKSHDRKITLGLGTETPNGFGQINLSQSITGKRLVSEQESATLTQQIGQVGKQYFLDIHTLTTHTRIFEKAYDHGIGLRMGRHIDSLDLRLSAGLDHEWGKNQARQSTVSLMAEKMFPGSPHSIGLQWSHAHKTGPLEPTRNDARGLLIYRYSLGHRPNAQAERLFQIKAIPQASVIPTPTPVAIQPSAPSTRIEKQWVKTKAIMNADAFFEFDSAKLTAQALTELQRIANVLHTQGREGPLLITGHTCDIGSHSVNDRLSLARAQAVKNQLLLLGVVKDEDTAVKGLGKRAQKYPATELSRSKNRRVELEFFSFVDKEQLVEIETHAPAPAAAAPAPQTAPNITYEREPIAQAPAWIQRAMRTPAQHNRTVSVYRIKQETQTQKTTREWINQAPVAQNDNYTVVAGTSAQLSVLDNDRDPDAHDSIALVSVSPAIYGQVRLDGKHIVYQAAPDRVGSDTFSYTIQDSQGLTASAQVNLTLTQVNRSPQANDDRIGVSGYVPSSLNVTGNDTDPDGDRLTVTGVSQPLANSGRVEITPNGILFTPKAPFMVDWFNYTISDGRGGSSSATVQLVDP